MKKNLFRSYTRTRWRIGTLIETVPFSSNKISAWISSKNIISTVSVGTLGHAKHHLRILCTLPGNPNRGLSLHPKDLKLIRRHLPRIFGTTRSTFSMRKWNWVLISLNGDNFIVPYTVCILRMVAPRKPRMLSAKVGMKPMLWRRIGSDYFWQHKGRKLKALPTDANGLSTWKKSVFRHVYCIDQSPS